MNLETKQLEQLKSIVKFAYENVPLYRERMGEKKAGIQSPEDLRHLPVFSKKDFENQPKPRVIGVSEDKLGVGFATSGTKGRPFFVLLTHEDFKGWLVPKARDALKKFLGITDSDIVVNTFGMGLIQPGTEYTFGAMEAGALVYPVGPGTLTPSRETVRMISDYDVTVVFATPSYALRLADVASEVGVDLHGLKVRRLMVTGEPLTPAAKSRIEDCWGTEVYNFFGMAEIGVAAVECWLHHSLHFLQDYLYPEILDPKTHSTLEPGEVGELVVTTFNKFGLPFVRYNTRDLVSVSEEACPCGFSGTSITSHLGRSDGMIKVKGKGVYPAHIEQVLLSTPELGSEYQIIVKHGTYGDNITVQAEVQRGHQADEELKKKIAYNMREELGVNLEIVISDYGKLSREGGWKAKRIVEADVR